MSTEENKTIIRRLLTEVWNNYQVEKLGEFFAENVLAYDATDHEPKVGFESITQVVIHFHTAFPDLHVSIYDMLAEGDKVIVRWGLRGTQHDTFMGVPPTGRAVDVRGIIIYRLENRKIVEYWGCFDTLGLMQQLGKD